MQLDRITPLILTYNEAPNIERVLERLAWAKRIVVIDSFSTDTTPEIFSRYPNVDVYKRPFDSFAEQCNFGLTHILTEWTLSLDADYILSLELINELQTILEKSSVDGLRAPFQYCVLGRPLRSTLLPPRTVLYRTAKATYHNDGHAHRVHLDGTVGQLQSPIFHDDRKSLQHWLWAQDRYALLEARKLAVIPDADLSLADKIRKTKVLAPLVILVYCLVLKGGLLDGWRGWYYAWQRMLAETLLALRLIEHDLTAYLPDHDAKVNR